MAPIPRSELPSRKIALGSGVVGMPVVPPASVKGVLYVFGLSVHDPVLVAVEGWQPYAMAIVPIGKLFAALKVILNKPPATRFALIRYTYSPKLVAATPCALSNPDQFPKLFELLASERPST